MANEVIKNDTAITLDWNNVTGATTYHLQVCESADFSGTMVSEDTALAASTKSFTDGGTNDVKRYWRWRYSTDSGATWYPWSEVGSYWLNTSFSADILLTSDQWALVNPSDMADKYILPCFPMYSITKQLLDRLRVRNRRGTLLSEFITVKDSIAWSFSEDVWITHEQFRQILRFHTEVKTFFVATYKRNDIDYVPNIWKAQFESNPELAMFAIGRQDILVGSPVMEEV